MTPKESHDHPATFLDGNGQTLWKGNADFHEAESGITVVGHHPATGLTLPLADAVSLRLADGRTFALSNLRQAPGAAAQKVFLYSLTPPSREADPVP